MSSIVYTICGVQHIVYTIYKMISQAMPHARYKTKNTQNTKQNKTKQPKNNRKRPNKTQNLTEHQKHTAETQDNMSPHTTDSQPSHLQLPHNTGAHAQTHHP